MLKKKIIRVFSDGSTEFCFQNFINKKVPQIVINNKDEINFYLNKQKSKPSLDSRDSLSFKKQYF